MVGVVGVFGVFGFVCAHVEREPDWASVSAGEFDSALDVEFVGVHAFEEPLEVFVVADFFVADEFAALVDGALGWH